MYEFTIYYLVFRYAIMKTKQSITIKYFIISEYRIDDYCIKHFSITRLTVIRQTHTIIFKILQNF